MGSDWERVREVKSRNQMDKVFTALPLVCFSFENIKVSAHKVFDRMLVSKF